MPQVDLETLEKIAGEQAIKSVIQYEVRMPDRDVFWFNDTVIGGFATMRELLDGFDELQRKYPDQIPAFLTTALREKESKA
jgi:hypothetical protein